MAIHLQSNEGKAKCGARSWRRFSFGCPTTDQLSAVTCKKCLGTGRKARPSERITENLVGKIIHTSWGYDMTINEFMVIRRQMNKTVEAEEIGTKIINHDGYGQAGHEVPDTTKRTGRMVRFLVKRNWNNEISFVGDGRWYGLHDGKEVYFNTLD